MSEMCDRLRRSVAQLTIKMTDFIPNKNTISRDRVPTNESLCRVALISTISPLCPPSLDFFRYFFLHTLFPNKNTISRDRVPTNESLCRVALISTISPLCPPSLDFFRYFFL